MNSVKVQILSDLPLGHLNINPLFVVISKSCTAAEWELRKFSIPSLSKSQTRMLKSSDPDTKMFSSTANLTELITPVCSTKIYVRMKSNKFQTMTRISAHLESKELNYYLMINLALMLNEIF